MKLVTLLATIVFVALAEKVSFSGYQLLRLYPANEEQSHLLHDLEAQDPNFDVWAFVPNKHMDVLLSPDVIGDYIMFFVSKGINFEVLNPNIQDLFDQEEKSMAKLRNNPNENIIFSYLRYNEIINFVDTLVDENSDILSSYVAGMSVQNRPIKVLVFRANPTASRALWIDCGIHAREWIATATCIYTIDRLLRDYRNGVPDASQILDNYELHIMPIVNPDGYEFSHTSNRNWRKNRRTNSGSVCIGVDLNRNFEFNWNVPGVSSTNPCSETYGGPSFHSEPESVAIRDSINAKLGQWDAYLTIHSYGQLWLVPFGYSATDKPVDDAEIRAAAAIGADAIYNVNGTVFTVGSSAEILYLSTGSSRDWANGQAGIKYSNTLELRPSQSESAIGFVWPPNRIEEVVTETFAGIMAFWKHVNSVSKMKG